MARPARSSERIFSLPSGPGPLSRRVADMLLQAIRDGEAAPGDALPPSRRLAADLGVSRATVVAGYDELLAAGYVVARAGSGTFVVPGAPEALRSGATIRVSAPLVAAGGPASGSSRATPRRTTDLRPGLPDTASINRRDWSRAWRAAAAAPIEGTAFAGHRKLAEALADHLRRYRGVSVDPGQLVLTPSVALCLRALGMAIGVRGHHVALEDPGYRSARDTMRDLGARIRPVPVDDDGLDPRLLHPRDRAVYLTPAHHFPTGARMPMHRRVELVGWAQAHGAVIIEDDYDGEFRYHQPPLPALRSIPGASAHVAYVGSISKLLTPSLRIAWLAPPPRLLPQVREACALLRAGVGQADATALTELIRSGGLTRHLARVSRLYSARREALVRAFHGRLPITGIDAGLHVLVPLEEHVDDHAAQRLLGKDGYAVGALSSYCLDSPRRGLLIGYATLPETQAPAVADAVTRAVKAARSPARRCSRGGGGRLPSEF